MKSVLYIFISALLVIAFSSVGTAQTVPPPVKKEILAYLKKQQACKGQYVQISVDSVKIGPGKLGLIGSCHYGGGLSVLYENSPRGLVKLLQVNLGMNSHFEPYNKAYKGYYDMYVEEHSGGEVYVTIYRWNGSRYFKYKSDY